MKLCRLCKIEKLLDDFHRANGTRDGHRGECKECFRAQAKARYPQVRDQAIERAKKWREDNIERFRENQRRMRSTPEGKRRQREGHLKRKFGMTIEDYKRMLEEQGGGCATCGRPPRPDIALHIDHDHETGRVRGLLCFRCNNSLGDLDDDPALLRKAAAYLVRTDPEVIELTKIIRERALGLKLAG